MMPFYVIVDTDDKRIKYSFESEALANEYYFHLIKDFVSRRYIIDFISADTCSMYKNSRYAVISTDFLKEVI